MGVRLVILLLLTEFKIGYFGIRPVTSDTQVPHREMFYSSNYLVNISSLVSQKEVVSLGKAPSRVIRDGRKTDVIISNQTSTKLDPLQITAFEQKLLKLMGLKERPKKAKVWKVPKYFKELYQSQLKLNKKFSTTNLNVPGRFTENANTVRSYFAKDDPKLSPIHLHETHYAMLNFNLSTFPKTERVTGAEVRVPLKVTSISQKRLKFRILIHDAVKTVGFAEPISYPVDSKLISLKSNTTSWITFDVYPAINRWTIEAKISSKENFSLLVELFPSNISENHSQNLSSSYPVKVLQLPVRSPVLLVFSDDGSSSVKDSGSVIIRQIRRRRSYRRKRRGRRRPRHRIKHRRRRLCSRKSMFVDFKQVGWDNWIVAPQVKFLIKLAAKYDTAVFDQ